MIIYEPKGLLRCDFYPSSNYGLVNGGSGLRKILSGDFTSASSLARATGPAASLFQSLAANTGILRMINSLIIWGELAIGIALIFPGNR